MQGFLGWVAYLGAANAGVPLSIIVKNYGWNACASSLSAKSAPIRVLLIERSCDREQTVLCVTLQLSEFVIRRYFVSLISACGVALLLLAPMVNLKNFVQREAARKAKLQ